MRKMYLVRHVEPLFFNNKRCCIGRLDLDISPEGKRQADMLCRYFTARPVSSVWCSPLKRSQYTAQMIANSIGLQPDVSVGLTEVSVGEWEGLAFDEIKQRWPELYEKRGQDPVNTPPPGGEPFPVALKRFNAALTEILAKTTGDIAVVSHSGVMRAFLCSVVGRELCDMFDIRQPYGCVNVLQVEDGRITAEQIGIIPDAVPDEQACEQLLKNCQTTEDCIRHGQAVAAKAEAIVVQLPSEYQKKINLLLLRAAALLHDMAKGQRNHPRVGADVAEKAGYPLIADIIAPHHMLNEHQEREISEQSILFFVDKLMYGVEEGSLDERFEASLANCGTDQAREAHQKRYRQALAVQELIAAAIGSDSTGNAPR